MGVNGGGGGQGYLVALLHLGHLAVAPDGTEVGPNVGVVSGVELDEGVAVEGEGLDHLKAKLDEDEGGVGEDLSLASPLGISSCPFPGSLTLRGGGGV